MLKDLTSRLWRDVAGTAVLETAIYLPIALLIFAGMADFSLAVSRRLIAQQAVARTLELASNADLVQLNEPFLRSEATRAANVPEANVQARVWLECDGVPQSSTSAVCTNSDGMARYASVTIEGAYQLMLYSGFAQAFTSDGSIRYRVQGSLRVQ